MDYFAVVRSSSMNERMKAILRWSYLVFCVRRIAGLVMVYGWEIEVWMRFLRI